MKRIFAAALSALFLVASLVPSTSWAQEPYAKPKYDREGFKKSSQSLLRADLLACRNLDAAPANPTNADLNDLAKKLNGVWLNKNNRTVHGVTVESDTAFYISMRGTTGQAILIDRNNLGTGVLSKPYDQGKYTRPAVPLTYGFSNCTFEFVDRYVKVTDEVPIEALASSTGVAIGKTAPLSEAWSKIVASGYFDSITMRLEPPVGKFTKRTPTKKVAARLGDGQRIAVIPDGRKVSEESIAAGNAPGAEYNLPMLTGGFFEITLSTVLKDGIQLAHMRWDAEYRGAGIGLPLGESIHGVEEGDFLSDSGAYVSARSTSSGQASAMQPWTTSECGNKNNLIAAEPEPIATPSVGAARVKPVSLGPRTREIHEKLHGNSQVKTVLVFDRVVIGAPTP